MKVVTKLAIALLLYNAVCVRLIGERERENIKNISNWYILFMVHFLCEITIDVLSEKIYMKSQYSVSFHFTFQLTSPRMF